MSGFMLLVAGQVAQLAIYQYNDYCRQCAVKLPALTSFFLRSVGLRQHSALAQVIWWFWLPMIWLLARSHFRFRHDRNFAMQFVYGFLLCWLALGIFVTLCLIPLAAPFIFSLASVGQPPLHVRIVPIASCGLIIVAIAACTFEWRRRWTLDSRVRKGVCVNCGYDLRSGHARCPECGTRTSHLTRRTALTLFAASGS
jgi:hypothetical protein